MMPMIPRTMFFALMLADGFGLVMALPIPILATMVSKNKGYSAGAVLGVQNAINSLGQAMGPLTGGLLFTLSIHLPYLLAGRRTGNKLKFFIGLC
jgi:DHA1 family multidrug resistance protein-like MFS transporter